MIIDSLTHITPDGRWFNTHHDASVGRLLREMDAAGVDKAVVVALAGYIENKFVANVCKKYEDRLIPGASIDPSRFSTPKEAMQETKDLLAGGEFSVLKLHPRLNGYDPLDKRCLALLEEISGFEKPLPIWLDSIFRSSKCLLSKPPVDTIQELAFRFPGLTFVLLHGCGAQILQTAELLSVFDNLILDLSLTLLYYPNASVAADTLFAMSRRDRRIIVGSDFPEYTPAQYIDAVRETAAKSGIEENKVQSILGGNLEALLFDES